MGCSILHARDLTLDPRDDESSNHAVFLIHDQVRSLSLKWKHLDGSALHPILTRVAQCHGLTHITIHCDPGALADRLMLAHDLVDVIHSNFHLKQVEIPSHLALQPLVWDAMRALPSLRRIHRIASSSKLEREGHIYDSYARPVVLNGGFSSLTTLSSVAPYKHMLLLFSTDGPTNMMLLNLEVFEVIGPDSIEVLCFKIATAVPIRLSALTLALLGTNAVMNAKALTHLTSIRNLRHLVIRTASIACVYDRDIDLLSSSMPYLEALSISPDPSDEFLSPPKLSLLALSSLAGHCAFIQHIGLFVDVSPERLPTHHVPLHTFSRSLQTINFGLSPAEEPDAIAFRLFRMFPHPLPEFQCIGHPKAWGPRSSGTVRRRFVEVGRQWEIVRTKIENLRPFASAVAQDVRHVDELEHLREENRVLRQRVLKLTRRTSSKDE